MYSLAIPIHTDNCDNSELRPRPHARCPSGDFARSLDFNRWSVYVPEVTHELRANGSAPRGLPC